MLVCGIKLRATLKTIHEHVVCAPDGLMKELVSQGINPVGNQIWQYIGCDGNPEKEFDLLICIPVEQQGQDRNGYEFFTIGSFKCTSALHKGSWNDLGTAYGALMAEIGAQGLCMTDTSREVYHCCDFENPENCLTEIQMGVR